MTILKNLKKGNEFKFNNEIYLVTRKYIDDNRPLIATCNQHTEPQRFHNEDLEIELIPDKNIFRIPKQASYPRFRSPNTDDEREVRETTDARNKAVLELMRSTMYDVTMVAPETDDVTSPDYFINSHPNFVINDGSFEIEINIYFKDKFVIVQDTKYNATIRTQIAYNTDLKLGKYQEKLTSIFAKLVADTEIASSEMIFASKVKKLPKVEVDFPNMVVHLRPEEGSKFVLVDVLDNSGITHKIVFNFRVINDYSVTHHIPCSINEMLHDDYNRLDTYDDVVAKLGRAKFMLDNNKKIYDVVSKKVVDMLKEQKFFDK